MDVVCTVANLAAMTPRGIDVRNHKQIVLAVMLDDTRTLKKSRLVFFALEDVLMGALNDIAKVGFQLHQFTCTIYDIHAIVVVEEQRAVVEMAHA